MKNVTEDVFVIEAQTGHWGSQQR